MQLVARAMVRGQGKTEGYHERIIPLRPKTVRLFGRAGGTFRNWAISQGSVSNKSGIVQRILSHAIQVFAARGNADKISPEHRALARPWLNKLDEIIDRTFFEHLQTEFDTDDNEERQSIRNRWLLNNNRDGVVDHARSILHNAEASLPSPAMYRYRARVNAEGLFEGRLRGNAGLPFLFLPEIGNWYPRLIRARRVKDVRATTNHRVHRVRWWHGTFRRTNAAGTHTGKVFQRRSNRHGAAPRVEGVSPPR